MRKSEIAERVIFQFPKILQAKARVVANRPIVIFPFNRNCHGTSLRVALNAGVTGCNVVHVRGVQDVAARWMIGVFAAWPVTAFASHVPFGDLLGMDVVVNGMAAVARGAGWALHIVRRIVWLPPVRALGH